MKMNKRISVRNLIEFLLRSGDIDNRYSGKADTDAMLLGSKLHRKIQKQMKGNYEPEVFLKTIVDMQDYTLTLEGRADGVEITFDADGNISKFLIDEIKTMYRDVTKIEKAEIIHEAQAMCYAYLYWKERLKEVETNVVIQLTYANLDTEEVNRIQSVYSMEEIKVWFQNLMQEHKKWVLHEMEHAKKREKTAREAVFPFVYRNGQKTIVKYVYQSIQKQQQLFVQAPTGVGKTMSVIFPAIKSIGENLTEKIFYLTAKTITRQAAVDAFTVLREQGLHFQSIVITAKDKMCVMEETKCNPEYCPRAKGHFDRVNIALYEMITNEMEITRDVILAYAEKYQLCPYEFSLDISNFADGVICDYNYAFDPTVCLKRYFSDGVDGKYLFLVDESHNLVERARTMYSADIVKEDVLEVKRIVGQRSRRLTIALENCNRILLKYKRLCGEKEYCYLESIGELVLSLEHLFGVFEKFLDDYREFEERETVLDFYFHLSHFLDMYDCISLTDEDDNSCYEICGHLKENGYAVRLMCINPAINLKTYIRKSVSTIFFSATLLPVNYYKKLLTGNMEENAIYIPSPFANEKRKLLIGTDVTSKYTRRNHAEFQRIADYIEQMAQTKKGNYMIFTPSYQYMEEIQARLSGDFEMLSQTQNMAEDEREKFLKEFEKKRNKSLLAFCVMGGLFSEGIDLTEDKLIGAVIVGTGLPQICMEREVMKTYFDKTMHNGFDYAYLYPGMNKVLQAAGRVIRTEQDEGVIALLDERFLRGEYRSLFPREWWDFETVTVGKIAEKSKKFWTERNREDVEL